MKSKLKNKLVKRILIIVLVILELFVLSKVYHFMLVSRLFDAVENFREEENRTYFVMTTMDRELVMEEKILLKEDTVKYVNSKNNRELNYIWKNFQNSKEYFIDVENKVYTDDMTFKNKNILPKLPNFIRYAFNKSKLNISKIFDICHIVLTKYENRICYKIVTKNEVIIIDKDTYLPIYSSLKMLDATYKSKNVIEKSYEFKVGEVTDEDVALPDLSEYTIVE